VAENLTNIDPYELCRALLDNSSALVEDAGLLLEHGRHPRAAALALMALEELSKVLLCVEAIVEGTPVPVTRSSAWRDHREKIAGATALELAFLHEDPNFDEARIKESVIADQKAKLACLYVDHADGQIAKPSELEVDATHLVDRAGRAAAWLRSVLHPLSPDVIDAVRPHREVLEQYFGSLVDEDDMAATVGRFRATVAAASELSIEPLDDEVSRATAVRASGN
jgi:AbiV family abortive infection protein